MVLNANDKKPSEDSADGGRNERAEVQRREGGNDRKHGEDEHHDAENFRDPPLEVQKSEDTRQKHNHAKKRGQDRRKVEGEDRLKEGQGRGDAPNDIKNADNNAQKRFRGSSHKERLLWFFYFIV